jgi:hypothetical protein
VRDWGEREEGKTKRRAWGREREREGEKGAERERERDTEKETEKRDMYSGGGWLDRAHG